MDFVFLRVLWSSLAYQFWSLNSRRDISKELSTRSLCNMLPFLLICLVCLQLSKHFRLLMNYFYHQYCRVMNVFLNLTSHGMQVSHNDESLAGIFGCAFPWSGCTGSSWPRLWGRFPISKCSPCLSATCRFTYAGRWKLSLIAFNPPLFPVML
jgi:hypothetical protein